MTSQKMVGLLLITALVSAGVATVAGYQIWGSRPSKPDPIPITYYCDAAFRWNEGHTGAEALRDDAPCFADSDICADYDASTRADNVQRSEGCLSANAPVSCFTRRRKYRWKTESICFASIAACRRNEISARTSGEAAVLSGCETR